MKIFSRSAALKKALEGCLLLFLCLSAIPGLAEEALPDLLSGFDDETPPVTATGTETPASGKKTAFLSGFSKVAWAYNTDHEAPLPGRTDWRGLSKLKTELQLEMKRSVGGWNFFGSGKGAYDAAYEINGREGYTEQVLDEYESEVELRELYLQGNLLPSVDLKLGRQIVVWGRSDNFRVSDLLNPLDNREPGLTDLEDLRLPLAMSKVDYYVGAWSLDLIAIHEHRFDKTPPFGHDFYPYPIPLPADEKPAHTLRNTEYGVDLTGSFPGWDLSFYFADTYNDQPNLVAGFPPGVEHRRLKVYAAAASLARGDFLLIGEAAHLQGLGFLTTLDADYERTDLLFGLEYSGFTETVLSCDYLYQKLHGYSGLLALSPEFPVEIDEQLALRISRDFFHDTLTITVLAVIFGDQAQRGGLERVTASWDLADNWSVTGGAIFYESGDTPATAIGDNDRVFLELRYDF